MLLNTQRKQYFYLVTIIINSFNSLKIPLFYLIFNFIVLFIFMSTGGVKLLQKLSCKLVQHQIYDRSKNDIRKIGGVK